MNRLWSHESALLECKEIGRTPIFEARRADKVYSPGRQPVVGVEEDFELCRECKEIPRSIAKSLIFHETRRGDSL